MFRNVLFKIEINFKITATNTTAKYNGDVYNGYDDDVYNGYGLDDINNNYDNVNADDTDADVAQKRLTNEIKVDTFTQIRHFCISSKKFCASDLGTHDSGGEFWYQIKLMQNVVKNVVEDNPTRRLKVEAFKIGLVF